MPRDLYEKISNSTKRLNISPTQNPSNLLCAVVNKCSLWQTPAKSETVRENTPLLHFRSLEKGVMHHFNELLKAKQFCDIQTSHATTAATSLMYSGEAIILSCVIKYRQEAVPYSKVIFTHILNSKSQNSWQVYFCVL